MWRHPSLVTHPLLAIGVIVASLIGGAVGAAAPVAAEATPSCAPGEAAAFRFGIGALAERLGPVMGAPLDCEHVDPASGITLQPTTTGLASYHPAANLPMFTDGAVHYALFEGQLVLWRGPSDELPQPTPGEAAYFAAIQPFRDRLEELQARLQVAASLAAQGQLDAVSTDDLSALTTDFWAARQAYANTQPSMRLERYDQTVKLSLAQAFDAAGLLLRARASTSSAQQEDFVNRAGVLAAGSGKLDRQAREELSTILPIVVG